MRSSWAKLDFVELAISPSRSTSRRGTCKLARNELWYIILGLGLPGISNAKQSETISDWQEYEGRVKARKRRVHETMKPNGKAELRPRRRDNWV